MASEVGAAGRPEVGAEAAVSAGATEDAAEDAAATAGAEVAMAAGELFCFWETSLLAHARLIEQ